MEAVTLSLSVHIPPLPTVKSPLAATTTSSPKAAKRFSSPLSPRTAPFTFGSASILPFLTLMNLCDYGGRAGRVGRPQALQVNARLMASAEWVKVVTWEFNLAWFKVK